MTETDIEESEEWDDSTEASSEPKPVGTWVVSLMLGVPLLLAAAPGIASAFTQNSPGMYEIVGIGTAFALGVLTISAGGYAWGKDATRSEVTEP